MWGVLTIGALLEGFAGRIQLTNHPQCPATGEPDERLVQTTKQIKLSQIKLSRSFPSLANSTTRRCLSHVSLLHATYPATGSLGAHMGDAVPGTRRSAGTCRGYPPCSAWHQPGRFLCTTPAHAHTHTHTHTHTRREMPHPYYHRGSTQSATHIALDATPLLPPRQTSSDTCCRTTSVP